ncbi:MAG: hypothetical protein O2955_04330 [Planctomycetota bacterium]|nr:hypothetical protein [Planctomycetota bacterium]MDA1211717.1 hypothetical protein [Planctomycetota bacterium]
MNMNHCPHRIGRTLYCWVLIISALASASLQAATERTKNFVVHAPTTEIAHQVGEAAEIYRRELALEWLGMEFKPWGQPCPITVTVGTMGAGGATTFTFDRGEVFNWNMRIQGSLERILDSVLPHEISHTIFATHFRRPLPRWADEGAATLVEHESERRRQSLLAQQLINDQTKIPLKTLLAIKEYPQEMQKVLMLYAEGYTLAHFLVDRGGKAAFIRFLDEAHQSGWDSALKRNYDYASVTSLEKEWQSWVMAGEPSSATIDAGTLATNNARTDEKKLLIRSQTPDEAEGDARSLENSVTDQETSENLEPPAPRKQRAIVSVDSSDRNLVANNNSRRRSKGKLMYPLINRPVSPPSTTVARPDLDRLSVQQNRLSRERLTTELPRSPQL